MNKMNAMKSVSVVIPTYNRADLLRVCIDSCLAQSYPCEIVVCDHGSTDNTPEVAASYGSKIIYLRREKDFGVHFCWLEGVLNASSEYIHINFDDDWIEPGFVEKCMSLMTEELAFVFSNVKVYDDSKKEFGKTLFDFFGNTGIKDVKTMVEFESSQLVSPGCAVIRKVDILENLFVGRIPFAEAEYKGVGPDLLFTLMPTLKYRRFGYVEEPLAVFRIHSGSITVNATADKTKEIKIWNAYDQARNYYFINKVFKKYRLNKLFYLWFRIKRKIKIY